MISDWGGRVGLLHLACNIMGGGFLLSHGLFVFFQQSARICVEIFFTINNLELAAFKDSLQSAKENIFRRKTQSSSQLSKYFWATYV